MKIPWIVYVGAASHALPLLVAGAVRPPLGPPRRWILLWSGLLTLASGVSLVYSLNSWNNHWLRYVGSPLAAAIVLWALSLWQRTPFSRLVIRLLIPLLLVAWVPISLIIENPQTFSLVGEPFIGLVVLAAAVYTLIVRGFHETRPVLRQDWFWIATGLAVYHGTAVALQPASYWLLARHPELIMQAYEVNAVIEIVAMMTIAWGLMRPVHASWYSRVEVRGSQLP